MKKNLTLVFAYFVLLNNVFAQTFVLYGDKTFGGDRRDLYSRIYYTGTEFILAGSTSTNINGDKSEKLCDTTNSLTDIWILKFDESFNIIWDKSIGGESGENKPSFPDAGSNKQILIACVSQSDSACEKSEHNRLLNNGNNSSDYWICKLDSNGNTIWDRTFGGNGNDDEPRMIQLSDGNLLICGSSGSDSSYDKTVSNFSAFRDYWAIKLDSNGHKIWDKVYGGTGAEIFTTGNGFGFDLIPEEAGGFTLAGSSDSPVSGLITGTPRGLYDVWIIKCDSAGNKIWDKRYGGTSTEYSQKIIKSPDGGYMVCCHTNSQQSFDISDPSRGDYDIWLLKLDSQGNKQWDKRYGGNRGEGAFSVQSAPDNGYWISGSTSSDSSYEVSEQPYDTMGLYGSDYWIFKIDSAGNKLWDKRFGGPGADVGSNFIIMPDTSIYFFGYADSGSSAVKTDPGKGDLDYWLVHFKYGYTFTGVHELNQTDNSLSFFPNPVTTTVTISSTYQHASTLTLYDITGRSLLQQTFNGTTQIDVSNLARGMYIAEVKDKNGNSVNGKLLKE